MLLDAALRRLIRIGDLTVIDSSGRAHRYTGAPGYRSVIRLKDSAIERLQRMPWRELLVQSPLGPGAQNLFISGDTDPVSHLRLNIFPDGGVARFRAFGHALPDWSRAAIDAEALAAVPAGTSAGDWVDLAAITSGGITIACSDAFYGPTNNLLLPGPAENMGGGWESRRKRSPGRERSWRVAQSGEWAGLSAGAGSRGREGCLSYGGGSSGRCSTGASSSTIPRWRPAPERTLTAS